MKKQDDLTTVAELKKWVRRFRDDRDWLQFHDPKNLAEAISIEAAELLELFLWKEKAEIGQLMDKDAAYRLAVEEELSDIVMTCLSFANASGIDVAGALAAKLKKAEQKYPVAKARGKATKYDRL
ncbi:MAG: nucleotide pyrophosphohydrolase [Patescibacteria group bacterium]|jgi:NTP pyrophosphatase (non-canonical NTP hydrolase)